MLAELDSYRIIDTSIRVYTCFKYSGTVVYGARKLVDVDGLRGIAGANVGVQPAWGGGGGGHSRRNNTGRRLATRKLSCFR